MWSPSCPEADAGKRGCGNGGNHVEMMDIEIPHLDMGKIFLWAEMTNGRDDLIIHGWRSQRLLQFIAGPGGKLVIT